VQLIEYQKELRSLASQLSIAEESERRRIAAQLHESAAQKLAFCSIKLGELLRSAPSTAFTQELSEIQSLIKGLITEMRSLIFELNPPHLYEIGLEAALKELTHQMREQHGLLASFRNDGQTKPIEDDDRFLLFQMVRELLVNVVKHARAHRVTVYIKRHGSNLQITVKDDGVGFDASEVGFCRKRAKGFGLFNVRERLRYIGGQFKVESEPGRGTRVTLTAPLKQE
jgi:signal transduction histidine kinase